MNLEQIDLFSLDEYPLLDKSLTFKQLSGPVWTGNKARLIARYLRYFTFITKHGTYLDLFAGPQEPEHPDTWAAKLVIETKPEWLRHFALFELKNDKFALLDAMIREKLKGKARDIKAFKGDMNVNVINYFRDNPIRDTEATFCLIDQHTFECDWTTVQAVASHKSAGPKIEQFYFLGQGWIDRAVAGLKIESDARMRKWWGNDNWRDLLKKPSIERGTFLADRFKKELGYAYSYAFPIFEHANSSCSSSCGRVMFYMIHASDHAEAPKLMFRAYNYAVAPLEPTEQLEIEFGQ